MNKRRLDRIGTLGRFVTLALLLGLGFSPRSGSAGELTTGSSTTVDDLIEGVVLDVLVSCQFALPGGSTHVCTATCSAEAVAPVGSIDNDYILALGRDGTFPLECMRSFELNDNPGIADASRVEVTTTCAFFNVGGGQRSISCAARKVAADDANMNIEDSSITCKCGHNTHE